MDLTRMISRVERKLGSARRSQSMESYLLGLIGGIALLIFMIPVIVLLTLLCSPLFLYRERRLWIKLRQQGRTIHWRDAARHAGDGLGTFVVKGAYPWGFADLWFVSVPIARLDPAGEMPRWSERPELLGRLSRAARNRLESLAQSASRVQLPSRSRKRISVELQKLSGIEFGHFAHVARTGELSDPFATPFADKALELLRLERERLLDLQDEWLYKSEYEAARPVHNQIQAVERKLRQELHTTEASNPLKQLPPGQIPL
jgi:hypothetical protein